MSLGQLWLRCRLAFGRRLESLRLFLARHRRAALWALSLRLFLARHRRAALWALSLVLVAWFAVPLFQAQFDKPAEAVFEVDGGVPLSVTLYLSDLNSNPVKGELDLVLQCDRAKPDTYLAVNAPDGASVEPSFPSTYPAGDSWYTDRPCSGGIPYRSVGFRLTVPRGKLLSKADSGRWNYDLTLLTAAASEPVEIYASLRSAQFSSALNAKESSLDHAHWASTDGFVAAQGSVEVESARRRGQWLGSLPPLLLGAIVGAVVATWLPVAERSSAGPAGRRRLGRPGRPVTGIRRVAGTAARPRRKR